MYSRKNLEMFEIKKIAPRNYMVRLLWHNSYRMGIVQLGAFLIQRSSLLLASSFLGLSVAASYGMTMTVLLTITAVGMVIMQVSIPKISALQSGNAQGEDLVKKYGEVLLISWFFYIVSAILLISFAPLFLSLISAKTQLLDTGLLVFSCVIFALELNHTIAATYLTTTNRVPFVMPAILSGVSIVLLGLVLVQWLGVGGLLLSQFIIQLAYNNWKWPLEVQRLLDRSLAHTLQAGWKSITAKFFIGRTQ
jgi:O-antigen/teichoic acid export membrane protein